MCGITGLIDSRFAVDPQSIRAAAALLSNRGPDDSGVWVHENVGFGHRRLSIIDPSASGHQPMLSADERYVIVFNGEIYNFLDLRSELADPTTRWRGNSDTEIILASYAKWGVDCLRRLNGMFAFAIWDRQEKTLFAARDRMGEKPFFYHFSENAFAFASRPRALFEMLPELPDDLDPQALRYYMEAGYVPTPHSIFKSVRKLPPAHYLIWKSNKVQIHRYWDFRQINPQENWISRDRESLLDELDDILSRSVRLRMISDVPLGAFLSGGVDSSLVAAIMAKHSSHPLKTFTIGFDGPTYDESPHAMIVAQAISSEHHCERMQVNDLLDLMPFYFREYDEPFADSSAFPTLAVSRAARRHVTVSLSGDGGDELFGGYPYYRMVHRLEVFFKLPRLARAFTATLSGMVPRHRFKLLSSALRNESPAEVFCFARSLTKDFDGIFRPELLNTTTSLRDHLLDVIATLPPDLGAADQAMRMDAFCTLHDDYLQKVDVASMTFSLESRAPFLDHTAVEWAMQLPLQWKLRGPWNKYLLRRLAHRYVPCEALDRPKHGFEVPIAVWLRGPLYNWARDQFQEESLFHQLPLNRERLLQLLDLHRSSARNAHPVLWAALALLQFSQSRAKRRPNRSHSSIRLRSAVGVL